MAKKKPAPGALPKGPFNNAFAGLADLRASMGPPPESEPQPEPPRPAITPAGFSERVVVKRERKNHGGKTVTRIRGLVGDQAAKEALAQDLAHRLGVGAKVEDVEIWVQGDQTERLQAILPQLGASRVISGN